MGELIRKLGEIQIGSTCFDVELNKPTQKGSLYDIHIQNGQFRLNMTEQDFCKLAAAVICGNAKLQRYKNGAKL